MVKQDILLAEKIATEVASAGGNVYYVGGFVRDRLFGKENKDVDIEVHGITPEKLLEILNGIGKPLEKGTSFGVYGLRGSDIDIAMPRIEKATGKGHKDFEVFVDPFIGEKNAAKRRDFTINAMMEHVLTHEVLDFYHGREDLEKKVLNCVCEETFVEDELRVFRGAQFAARFSLTFSESLKAVCRRMTLSSLARERVYDELMKALLKAEKPSVFFNSLREVGQLTTWFPEAEKLIGLMQNPKFHAEGDVWNHTMMVLDEAAKRRDFVSFPEGFMLTALMHDYGKIVSSFEKDGVIHSYNHENEGIPLVKEGLSRLTNDKKVFRYVLNMVRLHMKPNVVAGANSKEKTTNTMFHDSVAPYDLVLFSCADHDGRIKEKNDGNNYEFLMARLDHYEALMKEPYFNGDDLIAAGVEQNEHFSEIMNYAVKLRLAGVKKEDAFSQTLTFAKKIAKKK